MIIDITPFPYGELQVVTTDEFRRYETPEGVWYPSITTCLGHLGKDSLHEWRQRVGEEEADRISKKAAARGSMTHDAIEFWLANGELPSFPNLLVQDTFFKIARVMEARVGAVYSFERPLYSDFLGVAGRVDLVALFDGKRSIVDYKTSNKSKIKDWLTSYFLQETAYAIMWEERTGQPITQLVTILANDEDREAQVFIEHRDNWAPQLLKEIEFAKERLAWSTRSF